MSHQDFTNPLNVIEIFFPTEYKIKEIIIACVKSQFGDIISKLNYIVI